jgi:hypothetical protein
MVFSLSAFETKSEEFSGLQKVVDVTAVAEDANFWTLVVV